MCAELRELLDECELHSYEHILSIFDGLGAVFHDGLLLTLHHHGQTK
jgi:hypothetical protein